MRRSSALYAASMVLAMTLGASAKTTVTILSPGGAGPTQDAYIAIGKEFTRLHPDIVVKVIIDDWNIVDHLITQAAAGTGPDLAILAESYTGKLAWRGLLVDLASYMKSSKWVDSKHYAAPMGAYRLRYKGVAGQFGLPILYSGYGFLYNKGMLAKQGLPHPADDWNMTDFKTYVQKLTLDLNGDGKIDQYALDIQNHQNRLVGFVRSWGGDIIDEDKDEFRLNDAESVAGLQFFADLWARYHAVSWGAFLPNRAAMNMSSAYAISSMLPVKTFDWDSFAFPFGPKGQRSVAMPVTGIAMLKLSKHKDAAWQVIDYYADAGQEALAKLRIAIPVQTDAAQTWLASTQKPNHASIFLESAKYARSAGTAPYMDDVFEALTPKIDGVIAGRTDAATMVKSVEPEIAAILKKYKARMQR